MNRILTAIVLNALPLHVCATEQGQVQSGSPIQVQGRSFQYDEKSRLTRFRAVSGEVHQYKYDVLGRRVSDNDLEFTYLGNHILEEEAPGLKRVYIKSVGADNLIGFSEDLNHNGEFEVSEFRFPQSDHMRNTMVLAESSGQIIQTFDYEDYGEPLDASDYSRLNTKAQYPYLFTGRRYDAHSGLYYYRNRYVDPMAGRFISRDPIGNWGDSVNRGNGFSYVGSNPWSYVDPSGLKAMGPHQVEEASADFELGKVDWERIEAFWGMVYDLLYADAKEDYIFVNPDTIDWLDERATPYGYKTPPPTREEFIQLMIEMMPVTGEMVEAEALAQVLRGELPAWAAIPIVVGALIPFTPAIGRRISKWFGKRSDEAARRSAEALERTRVNAGLSLAEFEVLMNTPSPGRGAKRSLWQRWFGKVDPDQPIPADLNFIEFTDKVTGKTMVKFRPGDAYVEAVPNGPSMKTEKTAVYKMRGPDGKTHLYVEEGRHRLEAAIKGLYDPNGDGSLTYELIDFMNPEWQRSLNIVPATALY